MRIVITHTEPDLARAWRDAVARRLPQARVDIDQPQPTASADEPARFAIGWAPGEGFFQRHPALQAFFSAAAGVEHVLNNKGLPPQLAVVRLEDAGMGLQMVEYCLHEVLRLRGRRAEYERQQHELVWRELAPRERSALRIGVFGVGVLGAQVARAFAGLGYPVCGYSRTAKSIAGIEVFSGVAGGVPGSGAGDALAGFLARSDVLILLAPLTRETRGIIGRDALARLPRGAYLVNVARGALIDDDALLQALDSGHLAGASLDVFATEPLPATHPFWRHPKVRITPHISAITEVEPSADQVLAKMADWVAGRPVSGQVDRQRGY